MSLSLVDFVLIGIAACAGASVPLLLVCVYTNMLGGPAPREREDDQHQRNHDRLDVYG